MLNNNDADSLEMQKLRLERAKHKAEIWKWIIIAIGAAASFAILDYGKLTLERFKAQAENERQLISSYLKATDSPEPEVWKRKLNLILKTTKDENTRAWAQEEFKHIEDFLELDTLYRETLRVSSQLVEPDKLNSPERTAARVRYNQLYWADLPFAGESAAVIAAMKGFRKQLIIAETDSTSQPAWNSLNTKLIHLSRALKESSPSVRGKAE